MFFTAKQLNVIRLCLLFTTLLTGCVSSQAETAPEEAQEAPHITLYSNSSEIESALKDYAKQYALKTGVKVDIYTVENEDNYATSLKADFRAGLEPEIFAMGGWSDFKEYKDRLADLSDQPWVKSTTRSLKEGEVVYGFPVSVEGEGLTYNKELLDKAGIDPASLVDLASFEKALQSLEGMKEELEIDACIGVAASTSFEGQAGTIGFNAYLAGGVPYEDTQFVEGVLAGEVDSQRLRNHADYMALVFKHAKHYSMQGDDLQPLVQAFATEKVVFVHMGSWIDPLLKAADVAFECGVTTRPWLYEASEGIFADTSAWYGINSKSAYPEEAKAFLDSLVNTPEGVEYMVGEAGMIPAFDSILARPTGPLSKSVLTFMEQGKVYSFQMSKLPISFTRDTIGPLYIKLANGMIDVDMFCKLMTTEIKKLAP